MASGGGTDVAVLPQAVLPPAAPASVRSEPGTTQLPSENRQKRAAKLKSSASATDLAHLGSTIASAQLPTVGLPPPGPPNGWPEGQPPAALNYGMPYAFAQIDSRDQAGGAAAPDYYSLAPVYIHNGNGMVPYIAWDWAGYAAASQQAANAAMNSYGGAPRKHNGPRRNQHNSNTYKQQNNGNNNANANRNRNNNKSPGKAAPQQQQQQQLLGGRQHQNRYRRQGGAHSIGSELELGGYHSSGIHRGSMSSAMSESSFQSSGGVARIGGGGAALANGGRAVDYSDASTKSFRRNQHNRHHHQRSISQPHNNYNHHRRPSASVESVGAVVDTSDDAPDLERFLKAATPCVRPLAGPAGVAGLRLRDLWKFYEQASVFGLECAVLGGPRGPSNCYFVPYLSAVHLYFPVEDIDSSMEEEIFSFPQGLDSWPTGMRKGYSWAANEHVGNRLPLHTCVTELATKDGTPLEEHPLWSTKLVDLHPYSWFAVAWYPLYRIPDAPLTARFLTFHSLAPLWEAATAGEREIREAAEAVAAAERSSTASGSVASYKMMLENGRGQGSAAAAAAINASSANYPASPFNSEGVRTLSGPGSAFTMTMTSAAGTSARSHSVGDTLSVDRSFGGSITASPAGSDAGDDRSGSLPGGTRARSMLTAPAVGLCWHTAGNAVGENWSDTLVAVDVPEDALGRGLRRGDVLPGPANASVAGVWPRTAVIRKDYPLAKGGPLSWEIQVEELEEGARRLALQQGLTKIKSAGVVHGDGDGCSEAEQEEEPESCCPDYDFFSSRRR